MRCTGPARVLLPGQWQEARSKGQEQGRPRTTAVEVWWRRGRALTALPVEWGVLLQGVTALPAWWQDDVSCSFPKNCKAGAWREGATPNHYPARATNMFAGPFLPLARPLLAGLFLDGSVFLGKWNFIRVSPAREAASGAQLRSPTGLVSPSEVPCLPLFHIPPSHSLELVESIGASSAGFCKIHLCAHMQVTSDGAGYSDWGKYIFRLECLDFDNDWTGPCHTLSAPLANA